MAEKQMYISSCPVCGRILFKGTPNSSFEGGCPKCKEYLKIDFYAYGYQVCITKREEEASVSGKHLSKV